MTTLTSMAKALGGDVIKGRNGHFVLCPGPGHSARDRSLSVTPSAADPEGFVVFSHAKDGWRECRDHVLARTRGVTFASSTRVSRVKGKAAATPGHDPSGLAVALWKEGVDPRGTIVERYLEGRGLELPDDVAIRVVRFHRACPWRENDGPLSRRPCMLTAFRSIADDRLVAVHRTLLSADGKKVDRRMLGPVAGAAIKIDADENIELGLTVGEGFETCLAGRELGFRPVWALGSAGAIANFPVLSGIDALTILAETDDSGTNAKAIQACGNRWAAVDREVIVAAPRGVGDMNDALRS